MTDSKISDLDRLMGKRFSCRQFDPKREVERAKIEAIINAGRIGPSACNMQPYHFYAVGMEGMSALNKVRPWYDATAMILVCRDLYRPCWRRSADGELFFEFDAGLAMMAMNFKATELGLGSCFIASFNPKDVQQALNIPAKHKPYIALVLGHATMEPSEQHLIREDLNEIATFLD